MTTPAPRGICPPDHKHDATDTCYNTHRCGCEPCRVRNADRKRLRRRLLAYGRPTTTMVDPGPAREHIAHLREFGMGSRTIAAHAGLDLGRVSLLIWGRRSRAAGTGGLIIPRRIERATADAILAIKPDVALLAPMALIPARGAKRRIQALSTLGWTHDEMAARLGTQQRHISHILLHQERVTVAMHQAVAAMFDEWWNVTPPPITSYKASRVRVLKAAERRGYLPPLAWDDIDNDPTPAVVERETFIDELAVELAIAGDRVNLSRLERHEVVKHFHPLRWSDGRIADYIGCDERTILRDREYLGLEAFDQTELIGRDAA